MAESSPLPTAPPNPFFVARRIVERQTSSATCGWISGDLSKPVTCPRGQSCLYDTTSLYIAYCCGDLEDCGIPATACLDSSSAISQCGQEFCGSSTLQCTNSDSPFCQTLYWPFSNILSSFTCVPTLTSTYTAYDVYTTTTSQGYPLYSAVSSAAASSSQPSPETPSSTGYAVTSYSTSTSQSLASPPQISTSSNSIKQSPRSTYTARSSSTPNPLPSLASPFPTSTFDSIEGIAGAGLFFLVVISFLLTLILLAIGLLIMLYKRQENRRPSTVGRDVIGTEEPSYPRTSNNPNGFTVIRTQNPPMSGQSPGPPSNSLNSHNTPPSERDGIDSTPSGQPPFSTRQPSSSVTSLHSSGSSLSTSSTLRPLQDPHALGDVGQSTSLTSQQSAGMLSDRSGPQQVPPPGLISLGNLHLPTQPEPQTSEPSDLLNRNSTQPEPALNSS